MTAKKHHWHKFNFAEWRSDVALASCSRAARSLWLDMCGLIYEADDRGRLSFGGNPFPIPQLARVLEGGNEPSLISLISELENHGVFSRDKDGSIYSRRIRRELETAKKHRKNGKLGGNPALKPEATGGLTPPDKPQIPEPEPEPDSSNSGVVERAEPPDLRDLDFDSLSTALGKAVNGSLNMTLPGAHDLSPIVRLLRPAGGGQPCDLQRDVLPTVARISAALHAKGKRAKSWAYFADAIIRARDENLKPLPEPENGKSTHSRPGATNGRANQRTGDRSSTLAAGYARIFGDDDHQDHVSDVPENGRRLGISDRSRGRHGDDS